jgi:deazaflavin-dependent oxidoreductase (nitroreductase family)
MRRQFTIAQEVVANMAEAPDINAFNRKVIAEFRENDGAVTGPFAGSPLLLLTTTGAKSGVARTNPLVHTRDGDRVVVIASKGGAPSNPDWFRNLSANPEVTVELPGETFRANARIAEGDERDRLYRAQAELMPNFDEYAAKTDRLIPVVVLERVA